MERGVRLRRAVRGAWLHGGGMQPPAQLLLGRANGREKERRARRRAQPEIRRQVPRRARGRPRAHMPVAVTGAPRLRDSRVGIAVKWTRKVPRGVGCTPGSRTDSLKMYRVYFKSLFGRRRARGVAWGGARCSGWRRRGSWAEAWTRRAVSATGMAALGAGVTERWTRDCERRDSSGFSLGVRAMRTIPGCIARAPGGVWPLACIFCLRVVARRSNLLLLLFLLPTLGDARNQPSCA